MIAAGSARPYTCAMKKLVLIDGSSYLYRAFQRAAAPDRAGRKPDRCAVRRVQHAARHAQGKSLNYAAFVVDAPGPTFRDAMYPDYKANRPPTPDDLKAQIEPMLAIVEALGFTILRESGVEADDVDGNPLAVAAAGAGHRGGNTSRQGFRPFPWRRASHWSTP